jgi:SAM-dependent methyltransferase
MEAQGSAALRDVYERQYSAEGDDARLYAAWRMLCARNKADHVARLAAELEHPPAAVAEVGCGDGVLMDAMAERGVGQTRYGYEISERAVGFARGRPGVDGVERFDGLHLPVADDTFDLSVLSHVLEHVPDPLPLLRDTARASRAVLVEVPLEDNRSASRPAAEEGRRAIGHLHRFNRGDMHVMCAAAGLYPVAELSDPLPYAIHAFFARGASGRAKAAAKTLVRRALFTTSPKAAERAFTVHYACLAVKGSGAA